MGVGVDGGYPADQFIKADSPVINLQELDKKLPLLGRYHKAPRNIDDDYILDGRVLGLGASGAVKLARSKEDPSGSQRYAVKEVRLFFLEPEELVRVRSEVEVFLCMDHPHIARLVDVYESEQFLHLVMECLEGGELYTRVEERSAFREADAADTTWQILLALNYIHSHGIVHCDVKLENFMYDSSGGNHLKMIDFGFSRKCEPNARMQQRRGTLPYSAPEVLAGNYSLPCDLWSLGVVVYILLAGRMPFGGSPRAQRQRITEGRYNMHGSHWERVSAQAQHFTRALLQVCPQQRLTAEQALAHPWLVARQRSCVRVDRAVVGALQQFCQASRFRRCCLEIVAWSLSNAERARVRQHFLAMDQDKHGTLAFWELKRALCAYLPDGEAKLIFQALDSDQDAEVRYSDFLAAMLSAHLPLHDDLLRAAFNRFDADHNGAITADDVRTVLGNDTFEGERVEQLMGEADPAGLGKITCPEFVAYLRKGEAAANRRSPALWRRWGRGVPSMAALVEGGPPCCVVS